MLSVWEKGIILSDQVYISSKQSIQFFKSGQKDFSRVDDEKFN